MKQEVHVVSVPNSGAKTLKQGNVPYLITTVQQRSIDSKSKRYQVITLRLATFFGATNICLSLLDSAEFHKLIGKLDP